jgi:hypothetical protein
VDLHTLLVAAGMLLIAPIGFLLLMLWFTVISTFLFGRNRAY